MTEAAAVRKIAIFFGHVASNIGDVAINAGEVNLVRHAFPGAALQFVLLDPSEQFLAMAEETLRTDAGTKVSVIRSSPEKATQYLLEPNRFLRDSGCLDVDVVLLASGEHLFDYTHSENSKNLFWRILPAIAAKSAGKRCAILPSTFGPFETGVSKRLIPNLIDLVDGIAARDASSAVVVNAASRTKSVPTLLDPAFFLDAPDTTQGERDTETLGIAIRSEGWGIRLSDSKRKEATASLNATSFEDSAMALFAIEAAKAHLATDGTSVKIFVQTVADAKISEAINAALFTAGLGDRVSVARPLSLTSYLDEIAKTGVVLTSRFHAVILSVVCQVPVFAVYDRAHGHKMPGMFELLGADQCCKDITESSPAECAETARYALNNALQYTPAQKAIIEDLKGATIDWLRGVETLPLHAKALANIKRSVHALSTKYIIQTLRAEHSKEIAKLVKERDRLADSLAKEKAARKAPVTR
nr:polysaccharide pyruvyl transferase family protein [uncultured Shinella sp.]